ncbi:GNAT family N-acetyltransferase [Streptomyces sp. NPDC046977]|uniref:GNAT family N-acetyltransferase n=1 Tax=Streptomyces sp. NPDC046977 TaxID=3154703 RepID=UPI0034092758
MGELSFTAADDDLWQQYDQLATRSYGHTVNDITHLRHHADLQVATRDGRVVAGGLGLLVDQFFGGQPVPSACLAAGCVAPEERGEHLATRMTAARLRPLQEQGAVISTISTSSNGYARRMGWEAPAPVFAWTVTADDLKQSFTDTGLDIEYGHTPEIEDLQRDLARQWNGPVQRPAWWAPWKDSKGNLTTYRFHAPGRLAGVLSLAMNRRERHGMNLTVHDFWATDPDTTAALLAFLGRHNTRAETIEFRRGALPPLPTLLHHLHRHRVQAQAWHPWMLRILDVPAAISARGWPPDLDATLPIAIENSTGDGIDRYLLQIAGGKADLTPTAASSQVTLTRRQLAVWYAGGYRTVTAAQMSGVLTEHVKTLTTLIQATTDHEPWLPDHF